MKAVMLDSSKKQRQ